MAAASPANVVLEDATIFALIMSLLFPVCFCFISLLLYFMIGLLVVIIILLLLLLRILLLRILLLLLLRSSTGWISCLKTSQVIRSRSPGFWPNAAVRLLPPAP